MSDGQTATEDLRRLALRDGADAFLTVRSYLSTVRKHDQAALDVLKQLFTGTVWVPAAIARATVTSDAGSSGGTAAARSLPAATNRDIPRQPGTGRGRHGHGPGRTSPRRAARVNRPPPPRRASPTPGWTDRLDAARTQPANANRIAIEVEMCPRPSARDRCAVVRPRRTTARAATPPRRPQDLTLDARGTDLRLSARC